MKLNLRHKLSLRKFTKETREIDGKQYTDCSGMGLSGSIAAAFEVIRRDNKSWVPTKRYETLQKLMKSIEKDLKESKLSLRKKSWDYYLGGDPEDRDEDLLLGLPSDFQIPETGYDFGAIELGSVFHPNLIPVDILKPSEGAGESIVVDLTEPVNLPPREFISLKHTPELLGEPVVINNIDRALLPGGYVYIVENEPYINETVEMLQQKGYKIISKWLDPEPDMEEYTPCKILLQKPARPRKKRRSSSDLIKTFGKLSLRKQALDIGGVEFPDVIKYPPISRTGLPATPPATTPGTMEKHMVETAETLVYFYIKDHLKDYGVEFNAPDDRNIIQTAPDKIEFNPESPIIQKLFYDGWFNYLRDGAPMYVQENTNIQEMLLNYLINYFGLTK